MKSFIQIFLLCLMILIGFFFYKTYFYKSTNATNKKEIEVIPQKENPEIQPDTQNNTIKNLKYQVELKNSGKYEIIADLSELSYINEIEIVSMKRVIATFVDEKNRKMIIFSDKALFNNTSYDTKFENNTKIQYLNNIITSDKIEFNFKNNIISISENIIYKGNLGVIKADNIKINLITKDIDVFMNSKNEKIKITTN